MKKIFSQKYTKGLIIYGAALFLLLAVLIGVLCLFLSTYENNLPEKLVSEYIKDLTEEKIAGMISGEAENLSEFESGLDIFYLGVGKEGKSKDFSFYKKAEEYTSAKPVYKLIYGNTEIGKITLQKAKDRALFDLTKWEIDECKIYTEDFLKNPKTFTVKVPSSARLRIGKVDVPDKYITSSEQKYDGSCFLRSGEVLCNTYTIEGIYSEPRFCVSLGDKTVELLTYDKNGVLDWYIQSENHFTLTAPEECSVTVDGKPLNSGYRYKTEPQGEIGVFEEKLENPPSDAFYRIEKTGEEPKITGIIATEELEVYKNEENFVCKYPDDLKRSVTVILPDGTSLYVNGIEVGDEYQLGREGYSCLSTVEAHLQGIPDGKKYVIEGLLTLPEVSAELCGVPLKICGNERDGLSQRVEFLGESMTELQTAHASLATKYANTYITFTAMGAQNLEAHSRAVLDLMLPGSSGYKKIKKAVDSFSWVNPNTGIVTEKMEAQNFIKISDNAFVCDVEFAVILKNYKSSIPYSGTFTLTYIKDGESWLCAEMNIVQ